MAVVSRFWNEESLTSQWSQLEGLYPVARFLDFLKVQETDIASLVSDMNLSQPSTMVLGSKNSLLDTAITA